MDYGKQTKRRLGVGERILDLASLVGLILGFVMVIFGIVTGYGGFTLLPNFVDPPSILITI